MVWSNWQGAMWRGAVVALLFWAGLASTQAPVDPADRIVVVTDKETGKATRCRILETWRLPDGKTAQLLEALDTGEKITIVDEPGAIPDLSKKSGAVAKRIWTWGQGRRTPPEGSPLPPHLRIDSGIVIKNDLPPAPSDAVAGAGPVIVNRGIDDQAIGVPSVRNEGPMTIVETPPAQRPHPTLIGRFMGKREPALQRPFDAQVMEFSKPVPPLVVNEEPRPVMPPAAIQVQPKPDLPTLPTPIPPIGLTPTLPGPIVPTPMLPATSAPIENPGVVPPVQPPSVLLPERGAANCDPSKSDSSKPTVAPKKTWRPGANIQAWLQGKSKPEAPKTDAAKVESIKPDAAKPSVAKPAETKKAEDNLAMQNKVAGQQLAKNVEKIYGAPFSTAMMTPLPNAPEMKKPESSPLAIPKPDDKPFVLPPPPGATDPAKTEVKRDMWGNPQATPIVPVGRTLLDPALIKPEVVKLPAPPPARPNDPLLSPGKLIAGDRSPLKSPMVPPVSRTSDPGFMPSAPEFRPGAIAPPTNWPLGTQSVLAAHSGLLGQPMYIPVPTVTVPQPNNPPMPPAPKVPEAPNLNAYVNAFTPPPAPKGVAQPMPMAQNMMTPQAMMQPQMPYYLNPMMQQQPMMMNPMMQQQMMMQQMMQQQPMMMTPQMAAQQQWLAQQQMLMQYGYRPSPALANPYMAQAPSQGPMSNFSRHYAGPMPPNPFGASPAVQTGYAPSAYPMPAMMPQQQMIQPVSHQQPAMPTQQQSVTQQVEQLLRVLRESPYPAQREWAAQSMTSFEWRAHPQIVPALLQSASQDPAATVRAGCVSCLGRMNAAVEPVFGVLHAMRNDIDPRVRQEVEQAFVRLGQSAMTPQ